MNDFDLGSLFVSPFLDDLQSRWLLWNREGTGGSFDNASLMPGDLLECVAQHVSVVDA